MLNAMDRITTVRFWLLPVRQAPGSVAAVALIVAQLFAGFARPDVGAITTSAMAAQCILIAVISINRARGRICSQYLIFASAMLCWAAAYIAIGIEEVAVGPSPAHGMIDDALFIAKAAPLLLLFTTALDHRLAASSLFNDLPCCALFALLAFIMIMGDPFASGASAVTFAHNARDAENLLLAILAITAALVQRRAGERRLYRAIAALLVCYLITAVAVNHLILDRMTIGPGSAWLTIASIAFLGFHLFDNHVAERRARPLKASYLRPLSPMLLTAGSLIMAFYIARQGDLIGVGLGLAALAAFTWRSSLVQSNMLTANIALKRSELRLTSLVMVDALTGVANRRRFDQCLGEAWHRARETDATVAVLAIDVDWFKHLNDELGHAAGDDCLRILAQALAKATGSSGIFGRLGGEEFGVVALASASAAAGLAEQLRRSVEGLALSHPKSPTGYVTVSIGVGIATPGTPGSTTASDLVARADGALYIAKTSGRNRVIVP